MEVDHCFFLINEASKSKDIAFKVAGLMLFRS